jgi:hypothetical protein
LHERKDLAVVHQLIYGQSEVKHIKPSKQPGRHKEYNWYGGNVRRNLQQNQNLTVICDSLTMKLKQKFYFLNRLLD